MPKNLHKNRPKPSATQLLAVQPEQRLKYEHKQQRTEYAGRVVGRGANVSDALLLKPNDKLDGERKSEFGQLRAERPLQSVDRQSGTQFEQRDRFENRETTAGQRSDLDRQSDRIWNAVSPTKQL